MPCTHTCERTLLVVPPPELFDRSLKPYVSAVGHADMCREDALREGAREQLERALRSATVQ